MRRVARRRSPHTREVVRHLLCTLAVKSVQPERRVRAHRIDLQQEHLFVGGHFRLFFLFVLWRCHSWFLCTTWGGAQFGSGGGGGQ